MKRLVVLAAVAAALMVTPTAGAQSGLGGLGAGGIAACADANDLGAGQLAPVPQLTAYPGAPGPFAGPNSKIDYADGKNNGTDLVLFCQTQID
jgi:hypothetical protein